MLITLGQSVFCEIALTVLYYYSLILFWNQFLYQTVYIHINLIYLEASVTEVGQ